MNATAIGGRLEPVALLPSVARLALGALLGATVKPIVGRLPIGGQRLFLSALTGLQPLPRGALVKRLWMRGVPAEHHSDTRRPRPDAVLYVHGGAFVTLGPRSFRALAARLAMHARADVYVIDYRLAPEYPYPAGLDDAHDAYRWLLREGYARDRITIVGDSAGGGLALALLQRLRDGGLPLPGRAVLISPWLELDCATPVTPELAASDAILSRSWLLRSAAAYNGPSPAAARVAGLPPMLVLASSDEILLGDAERFVAAAHAAGVPVEGRRYEGLWHDFPVQAGLLPEASHAIATIAEFIARSTAPAPV